MRLFLVRHPKPSVAAGICYGSSDVAVAADEQDRIASLLAQTLPKSTPVISSPLQRCTELARRLADLLGSAPPMLDPRLAEMHFGKWEMQSWNLIPFAEVDAWAQDLANYCPGSGENVLQVATRVHAFYEDARKRKDSNVIVICHAGTIRLLLQFQSGLPLAKMAQLAAQAPHEIGYGEIVSLNC